MFKNLPAAASGTSAVAVLRLVAIIAFMVVKMIISDYFAFRNNVVIIVIMLMNNIVFVYNVMLVFYYMLMFDNLLVFAAIEFLSVDWFATAILYGNRFIIILPSSVTSVTIKHIYRL